MDIQEAPPREAAWQQYSVLVVDDEPGMVSFLQRALTARCGSVDTAGSVEDAMPLLRRRLYDLVVLDIALPGRSGIDWLHDLRDEGFAGDVVLMTAYADLDTAIDALRAGAADFLLKSVSARELTTAIENAAAGKQTLGSGAFGKVTASMATTGTSATQEARLTPRESQVLSHIAFGLSNEEIAHSLEISIDTVKEHVQNLLRKLAVNDRTQAAVWAVKSGVV